MHLERPICPPINCHITTAAFFSHSLHCSNRHQLQLGLLEGLDGGPRSLSTAVLTKAEWDHITFQVRLDQAANSMRLLIKLLFVYGITTPQ